jgi:two-component system chemotaxis response regulator CheY
MREILLVDNSIFMRKYLREILERNGYNVCGEACNGIEAFEKYKILKPNLVLMDIIMPEKNGIEALKDIISYDKNAIVIMCSSMGQKPIIMDAVKAGASDFIIKPFKQNNVINALKRNLNNN